MLHYYHSPHPLYFSFSNYISTFTFDRKTFLVSQPIISFSCRTSVHVASLVHLILYLPTSLLTLKPLPSSFLPPNYQLSYPTPATYRHRLPWSPFSVLITCFTNSFVPLRMVFLLPIFPIEISTASSCSVFYLCRFVFIYLDVISTYSAQQLNRWRLFVFAFAFY